MEPPKSDLQTFWLSFEEKSFSSGGKITDSKTVVDKVQNFLDRFEIDTIHAAVMSHGHLLIIGEGARTRVNAE